MSDQKQSILTLDWALIFYWMIATTAGWLVGWLFLPAIAPVTPGVGAGILQSFVLTHRIPKAWRWILLTAIGWLAGRLLVIPVAPAGVGLIAGLVIGATAGIAQWVLLRGEIHWAGWWIALSTLAWATGLSLTPSAGSVLLPRILLAGMMPSVLTGIGLELLLRNRKPTKTPESEE